MVSHSILTSHINSYLRANAAGDISFSRQPSDTRAPQSHIYEVDDIITEYHPSSKRPATVERFHEYGMEASSAPQPLCPQPLDSEPWRPYFETRQDFELAEIILEGGLDSKRSDALIKLINLCIEGKG